MKLKIFTNLKNNKLALILGSALLFFLSLVVLRFQVIDGMDISFSQAVQIGFPIGLMYDTVVTLVVLGLSGMLVFLLGLRPHISWVVVSFLIWIGHMSNAMFVQYYGAGLDVITMIYDTANLMDAPLPLIRAAFTFNDLFSIFLFGGSVYLTYRLKDFRGSKLSPIYRIKAASVFLLIFVSAFLLRQIPTWGKISYHEHSVVATSPFMSWWKDLGILGVQKEIAKHLTSNAYTEISDGEVRSHSNVLLKYRNGWDRSQGAESSQEKKAENFENNSPHLLQRQVDYSGEPSLSLRKELGLPAKGPIHFLVILLESVRGFEMHHPLIGPAIFPDFFKNLKSRAVWFSQAYTAGINTNRGHFSTMCSSIPNLVGPAIYQYKQYLSIRCLPQILKEEGYHTHFLRPVAVEVGKMDIFSTLHGTDHLLGSRYFSKFSKQSEVSSWGLDDGPVLLQISQMIQKHHREKKRFFGHFLTITTHAPFTPTREKWVPDVLRGLDLVSQWGYLGQLSRQRYQDSILDEFYNDIFSSEAGDSTAVFLVGDQIFVGTKPKAELKPHQWVEFTYRIPLAVVTKNMKNPGVRKTPVHQMDIAPTILRIMGYKGESTFLGHDLFGKKRVPFVYQARDRFAYRTSKQLCYNLIGTGKIQCIEAAPEFDPIMTSDVRLSPESPSITQFFRSVIQSNTALVNSNSIRKRR